MKELIQLANDLRELDTVGQFSMDFYNHPKNRYPFLVVLLTRIVNTQPYVNDLTMAQVGHRRSELLSKLMSEFFAHTWPSHEVHFHKSFEEYVNCPFTCLTEVVDCIDKITKGASS